MDPSRLKELTDLENEMNEMLRRMVPDAGVALDWNLEELKINFPEAKVSLVEDGYQVAVDKSGHGLQRTFLMTLLRCLAAAQVEDLGSTTQTGAGPPTLVLMIEEPELYQHPVRQRHLADVLLSLAKDAQQGSWGMTQVVYSTHSQHFVGLDRINQIRLLRKKRGADGKSGPTEIHGTSLEDVASSLAALPGGRKIPSSALESRLKGVMTPWMNEGFFSDIVVLVEGITDRAAILAVAKTMGYNFDAMGISVIPCDSKSKMAKPALIFQNLEVPVYLVWDSDSKDKEDPTVEDMLLLSLGGGDRDDWPTKTTDRFACFTINMNETLRQDIGEDFAVYEKDSLEELALRKQDGKNSDIIRLIVEKAGQGRCKTISKIVKKIITLSQKQM
ncbi:MAG: ATP-dependent endonuclease [Cenarchaeum sp. SB0665_bin_23]|nr:ATP-dependent endonuclease [Cenarchaeum sp. SB0665_bin_23]MYG32452.1 ATP-dependent endonuclease [Cenarchaeum sp. SB0677_bin_16]